MAQRIEIDDALLEKARVQCPKYLSRTAFINLMLDSALTGGSKLPAYCVGAGTQETLLGASPVQDLQPQQAQVPAAAAGLQHVPLEAVVASSEAEQILEPKKKGGAGGKKIDPYGRRTLELSLVPGDLEDCGALLIEFWSCKKGTRSQRVWNRVCDKLRQWSADQRKEALERAIAAGWGDVFEPQAPRSAGGFQRQPEPSRHPASREFRNGRFVDEDGPTTNPVLLGLM